MVLVLRSIVLMLVLWRIVLVPVLRRIIMARRIVLGRGGDRHRAQGNRYPQRTRSPHSIFRRRKGHLLVGRKALRTK